MKVSVIIPSYNAEKTIFRAIKSVLEQEIVSEIVVVDDKSQDNTLEILDFISPYIPNLRVIKNSLNSGVSYSRNSGILFTNNPIIAFLDADDVWLQNKINRQLDLLQNNRNLGLLSCDSFKVSPDGKFISRGHINKPPFNGSEAWLKLLEYNFIPTPTVLTYRDLIVNSGMFNENLPVAEDLDLWIKIGKKCDIYCIEDVLVHFYDYSNSLMKRGSNLSYELVNELVSNHLKDSNIEPKIRNSILHARVLELGKLVSHDGDYDSFIKYIKQNKNRLKTLDIINLSLKFSKTRFKKVIL